MNGKHPLTSGRFFHPPYQKHPAFYRRGKIHPNKQGETMSSYNVKALLTSVPVDPALNIKHNKLQQDTTLPNRTQLSIPNTFLTFQGKYYEQVECCHGSPLSPVIANLFLEDFKTRALSSSPNPPRIWLRFVDDTFIIHRA